MDCNLPFLAFRLGDILPSMVFQMGVLLNADSASVNKGHGPRFCMSLQSYVLSLPVPSAAEAQSPACFLFGLFISACGAT